MTCLPNSICAKTLIKHPMMMSHRKSKWASAPVLVVAISSPDPTIDPAKINPGPKFLSIPRVFCGGLCTFEFVGLIGKVGLLVLSSFRKSSKWDDGVGFQCATSAIRIGENLSATCIPHVSIDYRFQRDHHLDCIVVPLPSLDNGWVSTLYFLSYSWI